MSPVLMLFHFIPHLSLKLVKKNFQHINSKWKNIHETFERNLYISVMHRKEKYGNPTK
jgi:hypothetical protein